MSVLGPGISAVSCYLHREGIGLLYVDMVLETLREIYLKSALCVTA